MLPKDLVGGLYNPNYIPENVDLNNYVDVRLRETEERAQEQVNKKILESLHPNALGEIPKPLTKEEAEAVDQKIEQLRNKIAYARGRIGSLRQRIDQSAVGSDNKEITFSIDISKRPALKKAIKKIFGIKTNTITYQMYKQALDAKHGLENQDADSYLKGT